MNDKHTSYPYERATAEQQTYKEPMLPTHLDIARELVSGDRARHAAAMGFVGELIASSTAEECAFLLGAMACSPDVIERIAEEERRCRD